MFVPFQLKLIFAIKAIVLDKIALKFMPIDSIEGSISLFFVVANLFSIFFKARSFQSNAANIF